MLKINQKNHLNRLKLNWEDNYSGLSLQKKALHELMIKYNKDTEEVPYINKPAEIKIINCILINNLNHKYLKQTDVEIIRCVIDMSLLQKSSNNIDVIKDKFIEDVNDLFKLSDPINIEEKSEYFGSNYNV